jgi:NADH-quinone oxidoreductase subunit E
MSFKFSNENLKKIESLKQRYPKPQALTLPLLWMAQYQEGYISLDAIKEIAIKVESFPMEVYKVATFYTMFNLEKKGKYHIQVCKTLSCKLCGKDEIVDKIKSTLNVEVGETTKDNLFTLSEVECLGSCGTAPMMQINDDNYEELTKQKVEEILKELK